MGIGNFYTKEELADKIMEYAENHDTTVTFVDVVLPTHDTLDVELRIGMGVYYSEYLYISRTSYCFDSHVFKKDLDFIYDIMNLLNFMYENDTEVIDDREEEQYDGKRC